MTKKTKVQEEVQPQEEIETSSRGRTGRRKVYERVRETDIPQYVKDFFAKDDYELRFIRWSIHGQPDYRYLNVREQEGYEFVKAKELPDEYRRVMREVDTNIGNGLVTNGGDLCLMKIDSDLRRSREAHFDDVATQEIEAVDLNVLNKKGFITKGSKSSVIMREPSFSN